MVSGDVLVPYLITNAVAVLLLALVWNRPQWVRWTFAALFLGAGIVNSMWAWSDPAAYLGYADGALLPAYRSFIRGFFADNATAIVQTIAAGQLAIAALLTLGGVALSWGAIGAASFLIAIAPLGVGSALPSSLLLAIAALLLPARLAAVRGRPRRLVRRGAA